MELILPEKMRRVLTAFALVVIFAISSGTAISETFSCKGSGFEVDAPDSWTGTMSSSQTSIKLEPADNDELSVTIQAKKTRKKMSGNQVIGYFKKRWKEIKKAFPKSAVVSKPSKTPVGEYPAISYQFRYRNFLNVIIDERLLWLNPQDGKLLLTTKIEITGPARDMKAQTANIEYILSSFRLLQKEKTPPPSDDAPKVNTTYTASTSTTANNSSGWNQSSSSSTSTANPVKTAYASNTATDFQGTRVLNKKKFVPRQLAQKRDFKPGGLMSNAQEITDPEKLAEYQKTFLNRNTVRTAEQKARARTYSGGIGNAQVE